MFVIKVDREVVTFIPARLRSAWRNDGQGEQADK